MPHTIKITTANVTDRNGATNMISYYHNYANNLSRVKKVLADSAYSGKKFADQIKNISSADVEVVKRNELHKFAAIPNAGLLNVLSLGLIIVVVSGKIVKHLSLILFKWFLLISSVFYSSDPKQVLRYTI